MSHEKSNTPIDPNDADELGRIVYVNFTTQPGSIGEPASWEETAKWPEERVPWTNSALAVARAVCPDGYVVVPAAEIDEWVQRCKEHDQPHYVLVKVTDWLESLIPQEATR